MQKERNVAKQIKKNEPVSVSYTHLDVYKRQGKYGRMRRSYLKKYRKILYNNYVLEGTLVKHLAEIDQVCNCLLYTSTQEQLPMMVSAWSL